MEYSEISFPVGTRILVTGGAGFIGSNICEALVEKGVQVVCLDNFSTGKKENISHLFGNHLFTFVEGDITSFDVCLELSKNVDYIIHEAAWGSVPRSIEMPLFYEKNNILGTLNIFEAAKINKVKKVVYASSSSVYGDSLILPKKEGKEGNVLSPYALTKKVNEEYAKLYYKLYGVKTIGLRYFNVFGKRQNSNGEYAAVIPKFINACINNKPSYINGDGSYSRDFTYIDNVVEANLLACLTNNELAFGEVFNVACGDRITILDVYHKIAKCIGCNLKPLLREKRVGDVPHSNADISKIHTIIGYKPIIFFDEGIYKTIKWYKEQS